jgi:PHD/YefM family antitoxin component YafN of YafNO toxin-antitoxin module
MKTAVQYVSNEKGKPVAVQVPVKTWERLIQQLSTYEQELKIKSDLTQAFAEVKLMREGLQPKQTLSDFLDDL